MLEILQEEFRTKIKLKNMRQCLQDRKLQSFRYLEGMEGIA